MADQTRTTAPGWLKPIQGNKQGDHDQSLKAMASSISTIYESKEGATGVVSNVNIRTIAGFTTLFDNVQIAYRVIIRTDVNITVRFNSNANDAITVEANTTFDFNALEVSSIFITAAGSAALKVIIS